MSRRYYLLAAWSGNVVGTVLLLSSVLLVLPSVARADDEDGGFKVCLTCNVPCATNFPACDNGGCNPRIGCSASCGCNDTAAGYCDCN